MRKRSSRTCFEREARHAAMVSSWGEGLCRVVGGGRDLQWREEDADDDDDEGVFVWSCVDRGYD